MSCDLLVQLSGSPGLDILHCDSQSLCTLLLFELPFFHVIASRIVADAPGGGGGGG